MFPNRLSDCENASEGERLVYSFLKETARPDRDFFCWYTPKIKNKEADFIVFCRRHGLVVIEVKDWASDQIKSADLRWPQLDSKAFLRRTEALRVNDS